MSLLTLSCTARVFGLHRVQLWVALRTKDVSVALSCTGSDMNQSAPSRTRTHTGRMAYLLSLLMVVGPLAKCGVPEWVQRVEKPTLPELPTGFARRLFVLADQ